MNICDALVVDRLQFILPCINPLFSSFTAQLETWKSKILFLIRQTVDEKKKSS